ncbi:FliC/FljB family flagellin [Bordetella sp. BOR01]|uniref:FliC/FljB family flagellin n=1 Tax=Bordetella sp. BOR01 TaxID=2854779 RepID=UPI001C45B2DD|nr:FliC/FljB family flagellin [Bordetella sp. BOR01]MBV7482838.1 FliC/FljB family flagellin [Bordetella sp. BOR01]
MAAVINTNYLSLVAQNNLNKSQSALGSAIERLSSGLRINSAKDDAAGQAIANRFTANVRGLTQAARNANDGISLAQTTEGALTEVNNNLQRIRELAVQASTGTNSTSDLKSIQAEITQRLGEITRVSEQTQFNGVKVLAKENTMTIQVGANDGETIDIDLKQIDAGTLGLDSLNVVPGIDATGLTAFQAASTGAGAIIAEDGAGATAAVAAADVTFAGNTQTAGGTAFATGDLQQDADGNWYVEATVDGETVYYAATVTTTDGVGATTGPSAVVTIDTEAMGTAPATTNPLAAIDKALADVDNLRSDLGAIQNRFESTIANLNNTVNNLSAARSRIEDADYATEVSNMTKNQILQQAGTSVLAQANQVPQTVLSLLR